MPPVHSGLVGAAANGLPGPVADPLAGHHPTAPIRPEEWGNAMGKLAGNAAIAQWDFEKQLKFFN